jgi:flagellar motor switch protein FliM
MTTAPPSVLGRKTAQRQPTKSRSSFSPAMLKEMCEVIAASFSELFGTRSEVTLDSVGVEPCADLISALAESASVAVVELNGIPEAAQISFDPELVFHATDILLGADPETEASVSSRPPTQLDDKFCGSLANITIESIDLH